MTSLSFTQNLSEIVGAAFAAEGLPAELGRVQVSDRPDLAQFQCNGALPAKKYSDKPPRDIASGVVAHLEQNPIFQKITLAGPGFINLTLADGYIAEQAGVLAVDQSCGGWHKPEPEKIVIDYGGPNVAKPLHVGHLRAAIIGEALKRLMRAVGDDVTGDIHLGDWGKQMGQLITQLEIEQPDLPYFDASFSGPYPDESPVTMADLAKAYPAASLASKTDKTRDQAARKATAGLQAGRAGYLALWQHFVNTSRVGLEREYADLGVEFDLWKGESDADPFIKPLEQILRDKKLLVASDGAEVVHVARDSDKKDIPPLIVYSRDGSVLYGTTDLGTIMDRMAALEPDRILYVVDQRQAQHFEQVFRVAGLAGLIDEDRLEHLGFGTMNGTDGKPFKTRDGGIPQLRALIDMVEGRALQRLRDSGRVRDDIGAEELAGIASKVGMAALKFADLSNPRTTDYVFDLDRFLAFEGKTGPYLLYAVVRLNSVLDKVKAKSGDELADIIITDASTRDLILLLGQYSDAMRNAYEKRLPHILCDHIYTVAQSFSRFYTNCPIATETDKAIRASRIALALTVKRQMLAILSIIGIEVPERM